MENTYISDVDGRFFKKNRKIEKLRTRDRSWFTQIGVKNFTLPIQRSGLNCQKISWTKRIHENKSFENPKIFADFLNFIE